MNTLLVETPYPMDRMKECLGGDKANLKFFVTVFA